MISIYLWEFNLPIIIITHLAVTVKTSFNGKYFFVIQLSGVWPPGVCADPQWIWKTHDVSLQPCVGGSGGPRQEAPSCLLPGEMKMKHLVNLVYTVLLFELKKSKMLPVMSWFFCFTAHRLSLRCCHSLAQSATIFPKIFLPKAPVNKHKGTFFISFYCQVLSMHLCLRWCDSVRSSLPYLLPHALQVKPFQSRIPSSWLWKWRGSCNMVQHRDSSEGSSLCA